ncbi:MULTISPECIES: DUF3015 domain-containing protein [Pseudomonas]|uniref:DUF3015 domain-containing protein n=1 Tax=Pseudomonas alkylphenolica TaxID=237609 RepID=A0A077F8I9_9PSED|nr:MULTISPECIES: DUF3015 domain-containing protein [Pseudomonas]AIL61792.1 hypothetical protein PSAKL28_25950 [Pseudomonas alkylphenolica]QGW77505.1 DUF3015 domain-containing protein [Pseudomonas alkylphenolica]
MTNKLIGKAVLLGLLSAAAISVQAAQAGGNGCGWGNMLFEGKSGLGPHLLATTTNGTSGNATFGLTSGTNGCDSKTKLGYGGRSMLAMNNMLEGISEDMARGNGEALSAYATLLGVPSDDRQHFASVTHRHFDEIFANQDVTAEQVYSNTLAVMSRDPRLARYVQQPG